VFDHFDCVAIGEAPGVDPARAAKMVDPADPMLDMIYHFDLVEPQRDASGVWDRVAFKRVFTAWDRGIGDSGWNSVVLSNHDLGRIASRFGDESRESATMLLALVLTQRGTPFLYQGDELGVTNTVLPFEALDDVWAKTTYRLAREKGESHDDAFAKALAMTRDHARTPFQWNGGAHAGFSTVTPWLPANPNAGQINVAVQEDDPSSPLAFARALVALRATDPLWIFGAFEDLAPGDPDVFIYARTHEGRRATVALNLRATPSALPAAPDGDVLLSNHPAPHARAALRPWEARIYTP
jgi:glycosidase